MLLNKTILHNGTALKIVGTTFVNFIALLLASGIYLSIYETGEDAIILGVLMSVGWLLVFCVYNFIAILSLTKINRSIPVLNYVLPIALLPMLFAIDQGSILHLSLSGINISLILLAACCNLAGYFLIHPLKGDS